MEKVIQLKNTTVKKNHSHMKWAWVIMVAFLTLGIIDFRFGILGFACMGAPLYHAAKGGGKVHCAKYCPRGSLLGRMLESVSMNKQLPKFMTTKAFKNGLLTLMFTVFSFAMYHAGFNFKHIAFAMFRFMTMSLAIGIIMGIFFKPRSWCVVCPMGHGTVLLDRHVIQPINAKKQLLTEVPASKEVIKEVRRKAS